MFRVDADAVGFRRPLPAWWSTMQRMSAVSAVDRTQPKVAALNLAATDDGDSLACISKTRTQSIQVGGST